MSASSRLMQGVNWMTGVPADFKRFILAGLPGGPSAGRCATDPNHGWQSAATTPERRKLPVEASHRHEKGVERCLLFPIEAKGPVRAFRGPLRQNRRKAGHAMAFGRRSVLAAQRKPNAGRRQVGPGGR